MAEHPRDEDRGPYCDMCKEDRRLVPAVRYCVTCDVIYCESCLARFHPSRGPLKEHRMRSAEEYLAEKDTEDAEEAEPRPEEAEADPICEVHDRPYCRYCETCDQLICPRCRPQHSEHQLTTIQVAYNRKRGLLENKTNGLRELKHEVELTIQDMHELSRRMELRKERELTAINEMYQSALGALNSWRARCLEAAEKQQESQEENNEQAD